MSDLQWTCPHCGKHLVIEASAIGKEITCTTCNQAQIVPEAFAVWACSSCGEELSAAAGLVGQLIHCMQCQAEQQVPDPTKRQTRKIDLSTYGHKTDEPADGEPPAETRTCPECHAAVEADAKICVTCGLDLASGKHLHNAEEDVPGPSVVPGGVVQPGNKPKVIALSVVIAAAGLFLASQFMDGKERLKPLKLSEQSAEAIHDLLQVYSDMVTFLQGELDRPTYVAKLGEIHRRQKELDRKGAIIPDKVRRAAKEPIPWLDSLDLVWSAQEEGGSLTAGDRALLLDLYPGAKSWAGDGGKGWTTDVMRIYLAGECARHVKATVDRLSH